MLFLKPKREPPSAIVPDADGGRGHETLSNKEILGSVSSIEAGKMPRTAKIDLN